jgi:hypothetical protein
MAVEKQKITAAMLEIMTPLLLFLSVVGVLLPSLIRLKLGALEADLSLTKQTNFQGPTGDVTRGLAAASGAEKSLPTLK